MRPLIAEFQRSIFFRDGQRYVEMKRRPVLGSDRRIFTSDTDVILSHEGEEDARPVSMLNTTVPDFFTPENSPPVYFLKRYS